MKVIVIMAGGIGERFWPLSRQATPKQLLTLTSSGRSLLAEAVDRASKVVPLSSVYIATSQQLQGAIKGANLGIPEANIIAEPAKRGTAGCLIYTTATILAQTHKAPEQVTIGVLTADHRIPDVEPFVATVTQAMDFAEKTEGLLTVGIQPIRPETGYGYIEVSEKAKTEAAVKKQPVMPVVSFKEKPNAEDAAKYLAAGRYYWNSGMFFWRLSSFQKQFGIANPIMAESLEDITDALISNDQQRAAKAFDALPEISIDYALMEKASSLYVLPGNFLWDDLGSWDSLDRTFPKDSSGNVRVGNPYVIDTTGSIIYNNCGAEKMAVGVIGMKDVVVVATDDGILVAPKDRVQDVRKMVMLLRARGGKQL